MLTFIIFQRCLLCIQPSGLAASQELNGMCYCDHTVRSQSWPSLFIFKINLFILFLAALGLRCCTRAFSSCGERGLLFVTVRRLLIVVVSLVGDHGFQACRLSSCGLQAQLLRSVWDLPGPGLEPVSPALAGRFLTTAPLGSPSRRLLFFFFFFN